MARAAREVGRTDSGLAASVAEAVADALADRFRGRLPTVEQVQDAVERQLRVSAFDDITRRWAEQFCALLRSSLIAGTTAGIEQMFAIVYIPNVLGRHRLVVAVAHAAAIDLRQEAKYPVLHQRA